MKESLTRMMARFVVDPGFSLVPEDLAPSIRGGFIDTIACILSGRREPVTRAALALVQGHAGTPEARLLCGSQYASARDAAFVNAVAGHALDYDDMALSGHPSVVLVPALLAASEARGASGLDMMRAYLVGYEVWAELAAREPDPLHEKGWHPTGVLGTIAAAAAVAAIERLDEATAAHALGISASMASGLVANFGSMTKPLHAGWAAARGIEAVQLAKAGVTASADVLEAPSGFLAALSPKGRAARDGRAFADDHRLRFRESGLSIKKYPVCYASHRITDGVIDLKHSTDFAAEEVVGIEGTLSDVNARILRNHRPVSGLQAKFSLEFACAMAAIEGQVGLAQVTDEQVMRPDVQALMSRVSVHTIDPGCPVEPSFAWADRVKLTLRDGRMLDSGDIRFARGHAQLPLPIDELRIKFMGCVNGHELDAAHRLFDMLCESGRPDDAFEAFLRHEA
jgi:aconitate decarboxylase